MSEATGTPSQDPDERPDRPVRPPPPPGSTPPGPSAPAGPAGHPQRQPPGVPPYGPPQGPPTYPQQPYQGPPRQTYHGPPAQVGYPAPPGGTPGYGYGYGPPPGWSDKTKLAAGLLQLLPGFVVAIGGIGRLYSGHTALGVAHLVLSIVGWVLTPVLVGIPLVAACWLWAVVDGIVLLAGQPRDGRGLFLR